MAERWSPLSREASGMQFELVPSLIIFGSVVLIAVLGGVATDPMGEWYLSLRKPSWQPPNWLFGPAWTTIYLLLIFSAILVWHNSAGMSRTTLMVLYALNGALNLAWTFIFFQSRSPLLAGVDIAALFVTIVWIMIKVWPVSPAASLLLIPYLLWVGYASTINWAIVRYNG